MQPTSKNSKYPVFEANQILTNRHLNQVFNYLDEQERLTRANLIGIGIVCGLEVELLGSANAPTLRIGKGCGVTSEGYLIVEPEAVILESYGEYKPPTDVAYPLFTNVKLWEVFPEGEPGTTALNSAFLQDKALLLFLELKKEGLRNCNPANCDDRGAEVGVTLRRLLVSKNDAGMARLIDGTIGLNDPKNAAQLEDELLAKLNLPDIRLPRYNVPAGLLTSSNAVYAGFLSVFRDNLLASKTGAALTSAYNAFKPLVEVLYPANPFAKFGSMYGFLDNAPQNTTQVRFLQYYYDLFDDLLKAYEEFRWKGAELMCACCPDERLFPRHLLLGLVYPEADTGAAAYRHYFRASSAISNCETLTEELHLLFQRLVEMTTRFSNDPPLPMLRGPVNTASYVRITPSKLGDVPLAEKCIPYYYLQNGTPKLFELWNAERSRRYRAHHNLSYRYYEYDVPSLPDFVAAPLRYDLEPHNFLRVEGHINKPFSLVLNQLLTLKAQYRLPIDIVALRTGAFDENMPVDLSKEQCRFRDLESLYDATREEWMGQLCNDLTYLYEVSPQLAVIADPGNTEKANPNSPDAVKASANILPDVPPPVVSTTFKSKYALINTYAAGYLVQSNKLGGLFENNIVIDDPKGINNRFFELFTAVLNLAGAFPASMSSFNYTLFDERLKNMLRAAFRLENLRESPDLTKQLADNASLLLWEEIDDRIEHLKFGFRTDAFKAIHDEYVNRIKEVKQKQFLSNFLLKHPGIQHKAGVPLGGTFVLVYHDDPEIVRPFTPVFSFSEVNLEDVTLNFSEEVADADENFAARTGSQPLVTKEVEESFRKIQLNPAISLDPDVRTLIAAFSGQITDPKANFDVFLHESANRIISNAVNELTDGTVIADFFLPYLCCSDCGGVQYVLPPAQPTFSFSVGCTNDNNQAEVTLLTHGGAPPYSYKVDSQAYQPLSGVLALSVGDHAVAIRDAAGVESAPQTIKIVGKIVIAPPQYICDAELKNYQAIFRISGGTPPYTADLGTIAMVGSDHVCTSPFLATGTEKKVVVTDSAGCKKEQTLKYACPLPVDFSAVLLCTGTDKMAQVTITPTGGQAPYKASFDGGSPTDLFVVKLATGLHTIMVLDASGLEKTKQITVPEPFMAVIVQDSYKCSQDLKTFTVRIAVAGGTPDYNFGNTPIVAANGNNFTVGPFASGSAANVVVTDKNKCQVTLPVSHKCQTRLPGPKYSFSSVGTDKKITVNLNPEGGEPPYYYRINSGDFVKYEKPLVLDPGEYTLTIRDSAGSESDTLKISVPTPLQLSAPDFRCENGLYVVGIKIGGGRPPYKLLSEGAGKLTDANTFASIPVPGDQPLAVTIGDSAGQTAGNTYIFKCPPANQKPCGGIARKCSYRLWLQPGLPYEVYRPDPVEFTFTDEKGQTRLIPGLSVELAPEMINADFIGIMKALIGQINDKVGRVLGPGRLDISFDFRDGDPFARLWIECYECESFSMKFSFTYSQGNGLKRYEVRYMKSGNSNAAMFSNLEVDVPPVNVPAFDCYLRDRNKDVPAQRLCNDRPPQLAFTKAVSGDQIILTANTSGVGVGFVQHWIWEVQGGSELLYSGSQLVVKVPDLAKKGTTIKLTGITKNGCFATVFDRIPPVIK